MSGQERRAVGDGSDWEIAAGYSRAVRVGGRIAVSGTTGHTDDGSDPGDTAEQTERALRRALDAVERLDGRAQDVVRSRVYLAPTAEWQKAARVHRDLLGAVVPANTMIVVHSLIGASLLVEVELDAEVSGSAA